MTFQSIGKAFGLGFATALEQVGLLVVAGALAGMLAIRQPLSGPLAGAAGILAGLGATAAGGLALLQPAGQGAPRRAIGLAMTLLIVQALVVPSPLAVAAASVMKADLGTAIFVAVPAAAIAAALAWLLVRHGDAPRGMLPIAWLAIAIPIVLLVLQSVAQMPSEPLGKGGAREFYTGISRPLILAVLAIGLALVLSRRWQPEVLADTRWASLLLTVGAAGGFARVLDETGMAELLAEQVADPRLGLLAPFLAAATVKTLQGNSLSAVLTASGIVEPMLPVLGLDSSHGPRPCRRIGGRGIDRDLPRQRPVLLDRRPHGQSLAAARPARRIDRQPRRRGGSVPGPPRAAVHPCVDCTDRGVLRWDRATLWRS